MHNRGAVTKPRQATAKLLTSRALGAASTVGSLRHGPLAAGVHDGELGGGGRTLNRRRRWRRRRAKP
jgi:hypothetical protein